MFILCDWKKWQKETLIRCHDWWDVETGRHIGQNSENIAKINGTTHISNMWSGKMFVQISIACRCKLHESFSLTFSPCFFSYFLRSNAIVSRSNVVVICLGCSHASISKAQYLLKRHKVLLFNMINVMNGFCMCYSIAEKSQRLLLGSQQLCDKWWWHWCL